MTIDTNELRRLAQAATPGHWQFWHGWVAADIDNDGGVIIVERPTPSGGKYQARVDNNFKFIAAANPATINELLDRLEEAESDALEQARLNGMGAERELALMAKLEAAESTRRDDYQNWMTALDRNAELLAKLEAAEKERDNVAQQLVQSEIGKREISEARDALQVEVGKLKDLEVARCVKINGYIVDNARLVEEVERLRAKIAEMEKQEPVAFALYSGWAFKAAYHKEHEACDQRDRRQLSADLGGSLEAYRVVPLYALPGAKKQEPTRDWWDCLIADISAIDCVYRGSPTYAYDAYWMREHVVRMLEQRRDALPGAKGE